MNNTSMRTILVLGLTAVLLAALTAVAMGGVPH